MLNLNLYSFAKKDNSTKQPTLETAKLVQGILKEPCSIMTPIVRIERLPNDAMPFQYTYAKWVEAQRYYFIEDWTWVNGLWEVRMKEDVLATFKTQIGAETEYILRTDSTSDFNTNITDTTYPATTDIETKTTSQLNPFVTDLEDGCYIVGIISGGQVEAVGAISYYAMTSAQFGALKNKLFSDDNLEIMGIIDSGGQALVTDLSQEVLKTLYNPYQYIASCMWFPFMESLITSKTSVSSIKIGWWEYPLSGYRLYAQTVDMVESGSGISLHNHPQSQTRGNYLNYAPYTRRTLIGRYGVIPIDTTMFRSTDTIHIEYFIDLITGKTRVNFGRRYTENGNTSVSVITQREFLLGVPIQIAQVGTDYLDVGVQAIGAVQSGISGMWKGFASTGSVGGAIMGAIAGASSGIYNTIESAMPQVETSGSNGSFLGAGNYTRLVEQYFKIVDEDIHHRGRPLCELRQINTLSGFIMCAEGDIDISCYDNERKEIVKYLTTGFFWE